MGPFSIVNEEAASKPAKTAEELGLRRDLRLWDLVLFNIAATLGPQLIPAFAHVGPIAIPLHVTAAAFYFLPCALVIANLSRRFPGEGGFYVWTRHAFGARHAFVCGWSWWLSVLLFLPTLLLMAVGMATQAAGPAGAKLVENAHWQVGCGLALLWFTVCLDIVGLRLSKWLSNSAGTLIYVSGAIILVAALVVYAGHGSATNFHIRAALNFNRISLWAQIAFAYTGLELGSLMGAEIRNPRKTIPRAAAISAVGVALGYIVGTISLMLVLPPEEINPISGLVQVARVEGGRLGFGGLGTLLATLLFAGMVGKLSTWNGGAARLPFTAGIDGAFPTLFTRIHPRWRTPWVALVVQGLACSLFLVLTQAGETFRNGWQLLMDMEILVAFLPYIYIFLSAWKFGLKKSGAAGLSVTLLAMALALVPPEHSSSVLFFEVKAIGGSVVLVALGLLAFESGARKASQPQALRSPSALL
jgi:glutamate:GABA antiporter